MELWSLVYGQKGSADPAEGFSGTIWCGSIFRLLPSLTEFNKDNKFFRL